MDDDDPQKRIADLEQQLAEQKRIANLERQLAQAKTDAGGSHPSRPLAWRRPDDGDALLQSGSRGEFPRAGRRWGAGTLTGAIAGAIGLCTGTAAALSALVPSTVVWTSPVVCGAPHDLMIDTSHYSYKPGQSGTSVVFQCVGADGAREVSFLAIAGLQTLLVALVLGALLAAGGVLLRLRHQQRPSARTVLVSVVTGVLALAAVVTVSWQAVTSSTVGLQLPPGASLTIQGSGQIQTITACNGGHLVITGRAQTVTVAGHCSSVSVDGVVNHVTVDSVDTISTGGVHNVVTFHTGSPQVTGTNGQNTVQRG